MPVRAKEASISRPELRPTPELAPEPEDVRSFEPQTVDEETFLEVLGETVSALDRHDVPHAFIGGLASAMLGRPRWTRDIDILVRPGDADRALEALEAAGFDTQRTDDFWLFKGMKQGVLVDVIFRLIGDIFLDDEAFARSIVREYRDIRLRILSPEDLVVIKAVAHDEKTPRHWFDAIGILAGSELDWEYLVHRARRAPRRVLGLLLYAQSNDVLVPDSGIRALFDLIFEGKDEPKG